MNIRTKLAGVRLTQAPFEALCRAGVNNFKEVNLEGNFAGCDLRGKDFSHAKFNTNVNLSQVKTDQRTNFSDVSLTKNQVLSLYEAGHRNFRGIHITGDLSGLNLSKADFSGAIFSKVKLWNTNLTGSNLSWAKFEDSEFNKTNFTNASLIGAFFIGSSVKHNCDFRGADLRGSNYSELDLSQENLKGAKLKFKKEPSIASKEKSLPIDPFAILYFTLKDEVHHYSNLIDAKSSLSFSHQTQSGLQKFEIEMLNFRVDKLREHYKSAIQEDKKSSDRDKENKQSLQIDRFKQFKQAVRTEIERTMKIVLLDQAQIPKRGIDIFNYLGFGKSSLYETLNLFKLTVLADAEQSVVESEESTIIFADDLKGYGRYFKLQDRLLKLNSKNSPDIGSEFLKLWQERSDFIKKGSPLDPSSNSQRIHAGLGS